MNDIGDIMRTQNVRKQIKELAAQVLTKKARERLGNIRVVKPDFANQIEMYLLQLYQAGKIRGKIGEEELKILLKQLQTKRDFNIKFR